jgi:hypothetical protein
MAGGSWEILGTGMKAVINKKKKKQLHASDKGFRRKQDG